MRIQLFSTQNFYLLPATDTKYLNLEAMEIDGNMEKSLELYKRVNKIILFLPFCNKSSEGEGYSFRQKRLVNSLTV